MKLAALASVAVAGGLAVTFASIPSAHADAPPATQAQTGTGNVSGSASAGLTTVGAANAATTSGASASASVAPIRPDVTLGSGSSSGPANGPATGPANGPASGCVDEALKEELVGGRHYRGVQDRLFTKALRHEVSIFGGIYAADLYSSAPTYGAAYTFHFSEDLALEASMQLLRFKSQVTDAYEQRYPQVQVEERTDKPGRLYFGHLIYSFAYGKLRWAGGGISRFDFNVALGAGVTDDTTSRGITGSAGLGTKFYFGDWFALRVDIRDHLLSESLVGEEHLVNDVIATAGFSIFFPFTR